MRAKYRLFFLLAVLGSCLAGTASAQQTVNWQPTLETARRIAGQSGRLVLVHFWDDGCRPCQMMDRDVYSRADVAAAIDRDFVAVKVNRSHFPASASQYGVSAVPTDVIITPQGQPIGRHVGAAPASEYMTRLNRVASNWRRSAPASQYAQYAGPPQGPAAPPLESRPSYAAQQPQNNGYAANTGQLQPQGPPAMNRKYPGGPTANDQGRQFAARGQESRPAAYQGGGQRPFDSRYSPPLADSSAPSYQPAPDQPPYANRQQPSAGPDRSTSPALGGFTQNSPPMSQPPSDSFGPPLQAEPTREPAVDIPSGNPPIALDGYCPVQLTEKKRWVLGNRRWGLRHKGRTYLFAGPDEQRRFNERPDEYAPVMSGNDVVLLVEGGQTSPGRREYGAWFMGRMFLFADAASFRKFESNPDYYAAAVEESVSNVANRYAAPPVPSRPWEMRN